MGIYYFAADFRQKKIINPPGRFADKSPGFFHPHHPLPGMVMMMNFYGYDFRLVNDMSFECDGYEDITKEVYEKYLEHFEGAKEFYEKDWP